MAKSKAALSPYPHIEVRMEFRGGSSKKFYLITWDSKAQEYDITYGRIGTAGSHISYDPDKAVKKYEEKLKEGYEIVGKAAGAADFELPARAKARYDLLQGVSLDQLLARHGHKVVKFHDLGFWAPGADSLGLSFLPQLESWLARLGPDGVHNVREVFKQIGEEEDQEPTPNEKEAVFKFLLAVSDLV